MPVLYYRDPADEEWHAFATTDLPGNNEVAISVTPPPILEDGPEIWIDPSATLSERFGVRDGWVLMDDRFINAEGDAMIGPLSLAGPPLAPSHAASKAYVDDQLTRVGQVPIGFMGPFGGTEAPLGWHLCDGTPHGSAALEKVLRSPNTPDLRNRFIMVASDKYPPGHEGGSDTVRLSIDNMPRHSHGGSTGLGGSGVTAGAGGFGAPVAAVDQSDASGGHSHPIPVDGGGVPFPITPLFYAANHIIYKGV